MSRPSPPPSAARVADSLVPTADASEKRGCNFASPLSSEGSYRFLSPNVGLMDVLLVVFHVVPHDLCEKTRMGIDVK